MMIKEAFNFANNGDEFYTRMGDIAKELPNYNWSNMTIYCNCDNPIKSNFYKYFKANFRKLGIKKLFATYKSNVPLLYMYDGTNEFTKPLYSGNFQNNMSIVDMCDVVVTNPPYSNGMLVEFIDMMLLANKRFLIVGSLNIITKKKIFEYVKNGIISIGYTNINSFNKEDGSSSNSASCWWTNLSVNKPFLKTNYYYDENIYPKYDNYNAIDCSKTEMIPNGYSGIIGVPIRFITKYNPKQFELIGILNHPILNGKNMMSRILIQNKAINENVKKIRISESSYNRIFKKNKKNEKVFYPLI